jgi:hypothetical protein
VGHQRLQTLERQRQVRATLVVGYGVDLVDDHRAHGLEHLPAAVCRQQDEQRLRCRHEQVRWVLEVRLALRWGCIAGPHGGSYVDVGEPHPFELGPDAGQRFGQVLLDVVAERFER